MCIINFAIYTHTHTKGINDVILQLESELLSLFKHTHVSLFKIQTINIARTINLKIFLEFYFIFVDFVLLGSFCIIQNYSKFNQTFNGVFV